MAETSNAVEAEAAKYSYGVTYRDESGNLRTEWEWSTDPTPLMDAHGDVDITCDGDWVHVLEIKRRLETPIESVWMSDDCPWRDLELYPTAD